MADVDIMDILENSLQSKLALFLAEHTILNGAFINFNE